MIPSKPTPLRVVIQHPIDQPQAEIEDLFNTLLVPIVPKAFLKSTVRVEQEQLITSIFPAVKCSKYPMFAPKESKWGLTFFTAYHSQLKPIADLVLFLDHDEYGQTSQSLKSRMLMRDWGELDRLETVGSVLIGSALAKGAKPVEPKNYELANSWAREKAELCAWFLDFTQQPGGVAYDIFCGFEEQTDLNLRAGIKPVD